MTSKFIHATLRVVGTAALAVSVAGVVWAGSAAPGTGSAPPAKTPAVQRPAAATPDDGYRTATRLGGSRSLLGPIRDLKQLKRLMARPIMQKRVAGVLEAASLPGPVAEQVTAILNAADPAQFRDEPFDVGQTLVWMGLRDKGTPSVIRNIRWGGKKPFPAWKFDVDDDKTLYHFVLPKQCGNFSLASSERSPKDIAEEALKADEARKAEAARKADEARKAEAARKADDARRADEARKAALAPPACGLTALSAKAKGGYSFTIDGSASQLGAVPARAMLVQIVGPAGAPISVEVDGKPVTELNLSAPFHATGLVRKPVAGTYTVRAIASRENAEAEKRNCESSFTITQVDKPNFFVEGDFGKERRVREVGLTTIAPIVPILSGQCAPLLGGKFGVDIPVAEGWRLAPSAGVALNFVTGGNSSAFAELEINRWFQDKGFFGTGFGVWDFTHGDMVAPTWMIHGGRQIWQATGASNTAAYWVLSGRLFLDELGDVPNNYQFWSGVRFMFK